MMSRALRLIAGLAMFAWTANAADPIVLHVYMQPMARALPFYVGVDKGFFARHGLKVELEFTKSSTNQRDALASGNADIVYLGCRQRAAAMVEAAKKDVVIVTGGDSGTNEFYVQDYIKEFSG